jgi:ribosome-associated heat shock protein Hsp15
MPDPQRDKARLDQWLWYARFAKTRSLAARLCAAGAVSLNGAPIHKANQAVRIGDILVFPQGGWQRSVRVLGLGARRGPAVEARLLYEEIAEALRLSAAAAPWESILSEEAEEA